MRLILFLIVSLCVLLADRSKLPLSYSFNNDNLVLYKMNIDKYDSNKTLMVKNGKSISYNYKGNLLGLSIRDYFTGFKLCNFTSEVEFLNYNNRPKFCKNLRFITNKKYDDMIRINNFHIYITGSDANIFYKGKYINTMTRGAHLSKEKFYKILYSIKENKFNKKNLNYYLKLFDKNIKELKLEDAFESLVSAFIIYDMTNEINDRYKNLLKLKSEKLKY